MAFDDMYNLKNANIHSPNAQLKKDLAEASRFNAENQGKFLKTPIYKEWISTGNAADLQFQAMT